METVPLHPDSSKINSAIATSGCASLSGMLPPDRGDQATGFSTKDAWDGENYGL